MKKTKIIIANWKMKLSLKETSKLASAMKTKFKTFKKGEVVVCPNFLSLKDVGTALKGSPVKVGAQNVFWEEVGAYTGEASPGMLIDAGCKYAIIGHSERRHYLLENYEMIHKKTKAVVNSGKITPIVCIGESSEERKTDRRDYVLVDQLEQALSGLNISGKQQIIVAYEPIWAIGSGMSIEPEEAEYAHKIIKMKLNDMFGPKVSVENFRIIYGGSIDAKNAKDFKSLDNLDGLLVGGASLNAADFYKIAGIILG